MSWARPLCAIMRSVSMSTEQPVLILGSGGHAAVLLEALRAQGAVVRGFVAPSGEGSRLGDVPWLGDDDALSAFAGVEAVVGIGSTGDPSRRIDAHRRVLDAGIPLRTVIHPSAVIAETAAVGIGAQVLLGAVVAAGVQIGEGALVNSGAVVDHDCRLGAHSHVAPGAVLAGDVVVSDRAHVGLGARVIQGVTIGAGAIIGAGAVVVADVEAGTKVVGVPARRIDAAGES